MTDTGYSKQYEQAVKNRADAETDYLIAVKQEIQRLVKLLPDTVSSISISTRLGRALLVTKIHGTHRENLTRELMNAEPVVLIDDILIMLPYTNPEELSHSFSLDKNGLIVLRY